MFFYYYFVCLYVYANILFIVNGTFANENGEHSTAHTNDCDYQKIQKRMKIKKENDSEKMI